MNEIAQNSIILILCVSAGVFLVVKLYKSFTDKGCSTGCGACGAVDFKKIEKQIKADLN